MSSSFAYLAASEKDRKALASLEQAIAGAASDLPAPQMTSLSERWGCRDRCLLSYLRNSDVNFSTDKAVKRLKASLTFWNDTGLDREADIQGQMERHPLHTVWPMSFPLTTPCGCPVQFCRVAAVKPSQLTKSPAGEEGLRTYLSLWLARALELQAAIQRTRHCKGTYDVYDCQGASWAQMDLGALRTIGKLMAVGEAHFPDNLYKCFVINAPSWASFVWGTIKPFLGESTKRKISISTSVPPALTEALGGEAALKTMIDSVPSTLPVQPPSVPAVIDVE